MYSSEAFGRLFWVDDNYDFKSCPQFNNGTGDFDNEDYVSEWTDWEGVNYEILFNIHHLEILNSEKFKDIMVNSDFNLTEDVYNEVKKCYNFSNLEDNNSYIDSLLTAGIWHGN